jgi:hypothetical protein
MDSLQSFLQVPSWAINFCPIYLIVAAVAVLSNLSVLVSMAFMGSASLRALSGVTNMSIAGIVVTLLLNMLVVGFMGSLQYWVCKSALSPKEAFAVKCNSTKDCTDVAGLPQGTACTCGERGVCGSCLMQNNMQPDLFPNSDGGIMPFSEGFRVRAPFHRPSKPKAYA